jgi:cell division protein FtsI (penicillin-binding protein 3)
VIAAVPQCGTAFVAYGVNLPTRAKSESKTPTKRLIFFAAILSLWILAVCFRLVYMQVWHYGEWEQRASRQQSRTINVEPRRGVIYDRNGSELAMSIYVDSIFAVPSEIPDAESAASILGNVLHADPQDILARMKASRNFAWVMRKVDADTSQRVHNLNLKGVYFRKEPKRFYPRRELASQTLGYVGLDDEGLGGIELEFNDDLQGIPGRELISVDARRRFFGRVERQPEPGQNIVLTLDSTIQYIAEKELAQGLQDTKAIAGTVVVQNPRTGEILALANFPTFNPNVFNQVPKEALKNRAVSDVYEPGSVFKTVTYSSAIEEHLVKPEDRIDCQNGSINVFGMQIHDHERLGMITAAEAYAHSSDVAAIKVGMRLGDQRFASYIKAYGFGAQTGIELPGETRGLSKPASRWSKVSIGAISMGQEIGVTPVQVISMVSTIANDGVYTPPRIVAGELPPNAGPKQVVFHPAQQRRVISPETAVTMKKMMEGVVLFGTARRAMLEGYSVAGKTGTAQKVDPKTGTYSKTKYIASFVGFAPVNEPALTIAVILDSAEGLHQGGQVCAPVWRRIAQQVLEYMHVPHDVETKNDAKRQALIASAKDSDVSDEASDHLGTPLVMNDTDTASATAEGSKPASASPANAAKDAQVKEASLRQSADTLSVAVSASTSQPGVAVPETVPPAGNGTAILDVNGGVVVPSFVGKTLRSAVESAQQTGVEISIVGGGIAREQFPAPGSHLPAGQRVTVRFSR